jgi:hypothetical protein
VGSVIWSGLSEGCLLLSVEASLALAWGVELVDGRGEVDVSNSVMVEVGRSVVKL